MEIYCIEKDQKLADILYEYYWDETHVHWEEVGTWMQRAKGHGQYTYVHLDYCGHLKRDEIEGMQHWLSLMAPASRIRVSAFRGRRSDSQFALESLLHSTMVQTLAAEAAKKDTVYPLRWDPILESLSEDTGDTTKIIILMAVMNFFFGIDDVWKYTDACAQEGAFLPEVKGKHLLQNIQRFSYNEEGSPNYMYSAWCDLLPMPGEVFRTQEWAVEEMWKVFERIVGEPPVFVPTLYRRLP
ncbi:MAG TPA: hypothetical protein VJ742_13135 [Nitrososphaera sp.]|nr:hypothetical protein [Nitrososphaera sp.]